MTTQPKASDIFEGENSSMKRTFDEATQQNTIDEVIDEFTETFAKDDIVDNIDIVGIRNWLRIKFTYHLAEKEREYDNIFKWLLGEEGDFPDLSQKPHYSFRSELRKKLQTLNPTNHE